MTEVRHVLSIWWLEYEYRPYFHGDCDVLPYLITMFQVSTEASHIHTPYTERRSVNRYFSGNW